MVVDPLIDHASAYCQPNTEVVGSSKQWLVFAGRTRATAPTMIANAALPTISHQLLRARNASELQTLREAGESYGFFYLSLDAVGDEETLSRYTEVRDFMKSYFARPTTEKMRDCKSSDTIGYVTMHENGRSPAEV